jgi:hypothetical protein
VPAFDFHVAKNTDLSDAVRPARVVLIHIGTIDEETLVCNPLDPTVPNGVLDSSIGVLRSEIVIIALHKTNVPGARTSLLEWNALTNDSAHSAAWTRRTISPFGGWVLK